MYNLLLRSAWQTILDLCADLRQVGGLPGMTAVLHTWGSDMKHHVHAHCLVTYGGWDEQRGVWCWPRAKDKLVRHRQLRNRFRQIFLSGLEDWMTSYEEPGQVYHQSYAVLRAGLLEKSWVVNQQPPTVDAELINAYLSRYICRIGISDKRLQYDPVDQVVRLSIRIIIGRSPVKLHRWRIATWNLWFGSDAADFTAFATGLLSSFALLRLACTGYP